MNQSANIITNSRIRTLSDEAAEAGDLEMVAVCDRALGGDDTARVECARVILEAHASADD